VHGAEAAQTIVTNAGWNNIGDALLNQDIGLEPVRSPIRRQLRTIIGSDDTCGPFRNPPVVCAGRSKDFGGISGQYQW